MSDTVHVEISDGVAVVTLNRPERLNALNAEIRMAFLEAVSKVADDAHVGCVVVTGAGRGFCAGGDTKAGAEGSTRQGSPSGGELRRDAEAVRLLREMPKPTIAMINGPVAGAGIGIAGSCDLRFAARTATFVSA